MATKATAKTANKTTKKTAKPIAKQAVKEKEVIKGTKETISVITEAAPKAKSADIVLPNFVTVKNGFHGTLVYVSKKTGETFVWDEFGAEQDMELQELKNAKNSNRIFFENNWFMFDEADSWVVDYLGVSRYYKFALSPDELDDIFEMSAEELEDVLNDMSEGQKRSMAYKASQLIAAQKIDSLHKINVLEKCLGVTLIDRD